MRCTLASRIVQSREYKLMLDPTPFVDEARQRAVETFVSDQLGPAVRQSVGADAAQELATEGVDLKKRRTVCFRDTQKRTLDSNGFVLRQRHDLDGQDREAPQPEITLKFRSPDLFLAAALPLKAQKRAEEIDSKLEEDVGPLSLARESKERVAAVPRSTRSQFSRSTSQIVDPDELPETLKDIDRLYPTFSDDLRFVAGRIDLGEALIAGPVYRELVYRSTKLDLAEDTKAEFALTIWYKEVGARTMPALAEISFSYPTDRDNVPAQAVQRARRLLLAMQDLGWAKPEAPTKTALAAW